MEISPRLYALIWADLLMGYALFVMQNYLTDVWKLSFTHAAAILNIWGGISKLLPLFLVYLADTFLQNFKMLVLSSISYCVGIGLVIMSMPPVLGKCKQFEPQCIGDAQKFLFYTGMAFLAVGKAGQHVLDNFRQEQEDREYEDDSMLATKRLLMFTIFALTPLFGTVALPYIKSWFVLFGVPAICTLVATLVFLSGCFSYVRVEPQGSPLTGVFRVFVAAAFKKSQPFPHDVQLYHREDNDEFQPSRFLRCLDKAAIMLPGDELKMNRWRLCTVGEVEVAKIAVRMLPMWTTFITCAIISSIANTYFVEQATHLNRKIGKWKVPSQILLLIFSSGKKLFDTLAFHFIRNSPKRYNPPTMVIAVAIIFSILCCITAAKIESRRLKVVRSHGLVNKPDEAIPMSAYWLFFQFFLLAGLDAFFKRGVLAFYLDEVHPSMRRYIDSFTSGVSGLGFMCSVLLVYVVGKVSEKGDRSNWFQFTLNRSHLDRYYWVLASLSSVNFLVFILVASCYRYREREREREREEYNEEVEDA